MSWINFGRIKGEWWFRIFGIGLVAKHRSSRPLFTERHGYRKAWPKYPARWRFQILWRQRAGVPPTLLAAAFEPPDQARSES